VILISGINMLRIIPEEEVDKIIVEAEYHNHHDRDNRGRYIYKKALLGYIDEWKKKISESPDEKIVVRLKYIRNKVLGFGFENKSDNSIYSRIRFILLEYGIDVRLKHHYGANLILSLAREDDIISDRERARTERKRCAVKAGFSNWCEYVKDTCAYKKRTVTDMRFDEENKLHFTYLARKFIPELFPGAVINNLSLGGKNSQGGYDCIINGLKIKHIAARRQYIIKIDQFGREHEWEGWHWNILGNNVPDYYLLLGYGDSRENLEIVRGWLIPTKDRIRRREFWNREGFTIRTDKGPQLMEMSQYEIDHDKIEKIRKIIKKLAPTVIDIDDMHINIRKQIIEWYNTYFR
jgi:hypothetical protein